MKLYIYYTLSFLGLIAQAQTLKKSVTLEDIWKNRTFKLEYLDAIHPMKGDYYTTLEYNFENRTTAINQYTYKTLAKIQTIVDSKDLEQIDYFESYTFSQDESKILLKTNSKPIYRRSDLAQYYLYDLKTKACNVVSEEKIQAPMLSPDNTHIAYVLENNIYIKNLQTNNVQQITKDGENNKIINGVTDWVYEEELGFVRAFEWNADGTAIAYLKFNESDVPQFTMMSYGNYLYPEPVTFKYPKAGEPNSKVNLFIYDLTTHKTSAVVLGDYEYIARIKWSPNKDLLMAQTLNRRQNNLKLFEIDKQTAKAKLLLDETSDTYVNVRDYFTILKDNSFIWSSERDGWEHLYYYSAQGQLINKITEGDFDVTQFYGLDLDQKRLYYQSTENGSINKTVYSIDLNGKHKKIISENHGVNKPTFSEDKQYFILNFNDVQTPNRYTLHKSNGKLLKTILDNQSLLDKIQGYKVASREFSTLKTPNGDFNMWMIKPLNFDASKSYPLLMYQYSGPGSQSVQNNWCQLDTYWYTMLAEQGYIVACVDGRGTGGRGTEFTKSTYKRLGHYEAIDQIESAKVLGKLPYIDASRIGIWGWSFGGFTSSNALLKGGDVFKMAIAVAPVTSWRFYDTIYTERYLQTPQENPSGYDDNSPLFFANQLKGKYLLIHGSADDNVHVQNTMQMINVLIDANKVFDSEIYTDSNHGIYQRLNSRLQLYNRMTSFILQNL